MNIIKKMIYLVKAILLRGKQRERCLIRRRTPRKRGNSSIFNHVGARFFSSLKINQHLRAFIKVSIFRTFRHRNGSFPHSVAKTKKSDERLYFFTSKNNLYSCFYTLWTLSKKRYISSRAVLHWASGASPRFKVE